MKRKHLENGTWVIIVNHLEQTPEENLNDIVAGFFNPENLSYSEKLQIFAECYSVAEYTYGLVSVAEIILTELSDITFATKVYEKAEAFISDIEDYCFLSQSIIENLNDKEWSQRLLNETILMAEEQPLTLSYLFLAETYLKFLHDKTKSDELYELAYKSAKSIEDFKLLTYSVLNYEKDQRSLLKKQREPVTMNVCYSKN
jgi:hypothetical protein